MSANASEPAYDRPVHAYPASYTATTEDIIRMRAFQLFEQRGHQNGYDLDDWLQAEAEVLGQQGAVAVRVIEGFSSE